MPWMINLPPAMGAGGASEEVLMGILIPSVCLLVIGGIWVAWILWKTR